MCFYIRSKTQLHRKKINEIVFTSSEVSFAGKINQNKLKV